MLNKGDLESKILKRLYNSPRKNISALKTFFAIHLKIVNVSVWSW